MEKREALRWAARLYAGFPGRGISQSTIAVVAEDFLPEEHGAVVLVVESLLDAGGNPPTVADVRAELRSTRVPPARTSLPEGDERPPTEQELARMDADIEAAKARGSKFVGVLESVRAAMAEKTKQ